MKKVIQIFVIFLLSLSQANGAEVDIESRIFDIESEMKSIDAGSRLSFLERRVTLIDASQLNYKIEKDLLKETYSNNYEKISLFITLLLGLIAILGYLGIRDIGEIKEKYNKELSELRDIKSQFEIKSSEFDSRKKEIDDEIRVIIKENQDQNQKFKFIELKEKMLSLFKDRKLSLALEFSNAALDINPGDVSCLTAKGQILSQMNQFADALEIYRKSVEFNPNDSGSKFNYVESLYFSGKIEEAKLVIQENKELFENEQGGKLFELFELFELYHLNDIDKLKDIAKNYVTYEKLNIKIKMIKHWDMADAQSYAYYQKDGDLKTTLQNIIWYWNNQITGKVLLQTLEIPLPEAVQQITN